MTSWCNFHRRKTLITHSEVWADRHPDWVRVPFCQKHFAKGIMREMPKERAQRRLAAILAADVAGYSRLMGTDEVGTVLALREIWSERLSPVLAAHHGRVVKMMGDGALIEFAS